MQVTVTAALTSQMHLTLRLVLVAQRMIITMVRSCTPHICQGRAPAASLSHCLRSVGLCY